MVVAANLIHARRLRGMSQEEAGEGIAEYLGEKWSKARWSQAERSVDGKRVRPFSADELLAFSLLFDLPVQWFLMPPPPQDGKDDDLIPETIAVGDGLPLPDYLDRIFPPTLEGEMWQRVWALGRWLDIDHRKAETQRLQTVLFEATRDAGADLLTLLGWVAQSQKEIEGLSQAMKGVADHLNNPRRQLEKILRDHMPKELMEGEEE